ncbi:hypothetical protein EG028_19375 [Chitinophaga barathri]|uniref:BZIP transcription factor n=2 Tax=Chitinophaga barathri TaxID=1647451 RepID=A0A3N4M7F0_9BACT|nr:hypothetical protein EG028_19375 [Chitinophaga barathri]
MAPVGGVAEQALNVGGKIKLLGTPGTYTLGTDGNQPTIYRTIPVTGGLYPFNNYDNLVIQGGYATRDIIFVTGTTPAPRLTITGSGNVGIGTNITGTYKLAVEGTIGARKVKVTTTAWADFVFHPDYDLPSLAEVESFIKTNGHLPEIPSEKEVMETGIDLGDMNKKLLQKVEELTLYLIELKKENAGIKKQYGEQIDALLKRIETLEKQ